MSVLLSGKGTVNVKSSVSVTTTHTGTVQTGREGRAWPARAPVSPAFVETNAPAVQCSQQMERQRQLGTRNGWGGSGDTPEIQTTPQRERATEAAGLAGAAPITSPTQIPGAR